MGCLRVIGSSMKDVCRNFVIPPPKFSRGTSCRIQRSQSIIVDRLHVTIFVLNRISSLTQEFLEKYGHFSLF